MFNVRLKLEEWIDVKVKVDFQIEKNMSNSKNRYVPDTANFQLQNVRNVGLIDKIRLYQNSIEVGVYKENGDLFWYGVINQKDKKLKIRRNISTYSFTAKDYVETLKVPNTQYWKRTNTSISSIANDLCQFAGATFVAPPRMDKIKDYFFVTDLKENIFKILDNFLYEHGWVIATRYFGPNPVISAFSYWDRENTPSTIITSKDIYEKSGVNEQVKNPKEIKLFKTNYRVIKNFTNIILHLDGVTEPIEIEAGGFYPEGGDTKPQYQKYTILHPENFPKAPDTFPLNEKLKWGTITKDAEIVYASNQITGFNNVSPNTSDPYIYINEHKPDESRVVIAKNVDFYRKGEEFRVIGDTRVRKLPPGCSEIIDRQDFLRENPQYVIAKNFGDISDKERKEVIDYLHRNRLVGDSKPGIERLINTGGIVIAGINNRGEPIVDQWIIDRIIAHNNNLGKYTPTVFHRTSEWYKTKPEALDAAKVEFEERPCSGDSRPVAEPVFEERDTRIAEANAKISNFTITGDAVISVGIGTSSAGLFNRVGDSLGDSLFDRTREYTINHISAGTLSILLEEML